MDTRGGHWEPNRHEVWRLQRAKGKLGLHPKDGQSLVVGNQRLGVSEEGGKPELESHWGTVTRRNNFPITSAAPSPGTREPRK